MTTEGRVQGVKAASAAGEHGSGAHPGGEAGRNRFAGLTGTLTAGLVVLTVSVLVAQAWGWLNGHPGPGAAMVAGHVVTALFAVAAQRVADREPGARAAACQLFVGLTTLGVLALLWWL